MCYWFFGQFFCELISQLFHSKLDLMFSSVYSFFFFLSWYLVFFCDLIVILYKLTILALLIEPSHLQIFSEFDPTPIASASLAQVHVARTIDGQKVAVKVSFVLTFLKKNFISDSWSQNFHVELFWRHVVFLMRISFPYPNNFSYSGPAHSHDWYCGCRSCHCGYDCEHRTSIFSFFWLQVLW